MDGVEDLEVRRLALWGEHSGAEVVHWEDDHEKGDDGVEAHRANDRLLVERPEKALLVAERKEDKQADQRRPEAEQERHLVRLIGQLAVADRRESEGPEAPNWSQYRIPYTNQHPISMGTKQSVAHGTCGVGWS